MPNDRHRAIARSRKRRLDRTTNMFERINLKFIYSFDELCRNMRKVGNTLADVCLSLMPYRKRTLQELWKKNKRRR